MQDWTKYLREPAGLYLNDDEGYLFDDGQNAALGAITNTSRTIAADKGFWAYNVFAYGEPHIVFHFSDVTDENGQPFDNQVTGNDDAYLTVTRFVDSVTGNPVEFEGGYIYRIDDLVFKTSDLGETPKRTKKEMYT